MYAELPSHGGITEHGTHLIVLSIIENLNKDKKIANKKDVSDRVKLYSSHMGFIITSLLEKGYIKRESDWNRFDTDSYNITESGTNVLERNRIMVKNLVTSMMALCHKKEREQLYESVTENRESVWFAFYEGFLTKDEMMNITQVLRLGIRHFLWDRSFQKVVDVAWPGYGFW